MPDDQWQAFGDKEGAIVGEALAERFRETAAASDQRAIFPGSWEFNIRGIYRDGALGTTPRSSGSAGTISTSGRLHERRGGLVHHPYR